jgi:hypothetical protein
MRGEREPAFAAGELGNGQDQSYLCNMSFDQYQHYLPKSYQRGWTTGGRLHVYQWAYNRLVCQPKVPKSTGGRHGLYFIPMAPPDEQNLMEDKFWKRIDQWGADGLKLLRSNDPTAAAKMNKVGWTKFIMSLLFPQPQRRKNLQCLGDGKRSERVPERRLCQTSTATRARQL